MVIGFKKQFVEPILQGTKVHTIRSDEHDRWFPGRVMHMATGTRSKYYNCFKETPCISTQRIFMTYDWMLHISIGWDCGCELYHDEKEKLAKNDGFENFKAFENWWYPILAENNKGYTGKIIHWTSLRY